MAALTRPRPTTAEVLRLDPDDLLAQAGMARVLAARGEAQEAIALYRSLVEQLPLPELVIALGELYEHTGQQGEANIQYALVRAMQQLNASAGMNVDMELALFNANHGTAPDEAVAQARAAHEQRPGIYSADALAWSLFRNGDPDAARPLIEEALRLGTRDAMLYFHAGVIAHAQGDEAAAREHLQQALAINPYFSPLHAAETERLLADLGGE